MQSQQVNETNTIEDDDMLKSSQSTNMSQKNVPSASILGKLQKYENKKYTIHNILAQN